MTTTELEDVLEEALDSQLGCMRQQLQTVIGNTYQTSTNTAWLMLGVWILLLYTVGNDVWARVAAWL